MKKTIKDIGFLKPLVIFWRKIRLLFFAYFNLTKEIEVKSSTLDEKIFFNTRNSLTANFCKNNIKNNKLDYEPSQRELFISLVNKNDVVFDVGSQIGFYSVLAAKLEAKVFSFDIDKESLVVAKKNANKNNVSDSIDFINKAVGSGSSKANIKNFNKESFSHTISLDEFCSKKSIWPDFVKMDIEGYELEALSNASKLLKKKPIIMLALHPPFIKNLNQEPEDLFNLLFKYNYEIISLGPIKKGEIVKDDYNLLLNDLNDFICIPKNKKLLNDIKNSI